MTNFAVSVLRRGNSHADAFGSFAVAMILYFVAVGVTRAVCGDVLLVRHSRDPGPNASIDSVSASILIGSAAAVLVFGVAVFSGPDVRPALLALAVTLPVLCLQDTLRFVFIAGNRPDRAFVNDAVWAAAQIAILGAVVVWSDPGPGTLMLGWGLSAGVAAIAGLVLVGSPRPQAARRWIEDGRSLWPRFLGEFVATMGTWQLVLLGVGGIAGLTALAGLRGCQVVFGPLHVANSGALLVAVPEGVRSRGDGPRAVQLGLRVAMVLMALGSLFTVAWLILPDRVGTAVLGDTWALTSEIVLPFGLFMTAEAAVFGAGVALRIRADAVGALRAAASSAGVMLVLLLGAAVWGSLSLIAWALAVSGVLGAIVWWTTVLLRMRSWHDLPLPVEPTPIGDPSLTVQPRGGRPLT